MYKLKSISSLNIHSPKNSSFFILESDPKFPNLLSFHSRWPSRGSWTGQLKEEELVLDAQSDSWKTLMVIRSECYWSELWWDVKYRDEHNDDVLLATFFPLNKRATMPLQASLNLSKSFQDIKPRKLLEPASISRNKKHTKRIYLFFSVPDFEPKRLAGRRWDGLLWTLKAKTFLIGASVSRFWVHWTVASHICETIISPKFLQECW